MLRSRLRARWAAVAIVTIAVVAGVVVIAVGAPLGATVYDIAVPLSLLVAGVAGVAIPLALWRPMLGTALSVGALLTFSAVAAANPNAPWPVAATSTVALCFVLGIAGARASWPVAATGWAIAVAGSLVITTVRDPGQIGSAAIVADLTVFAAVTLVVLLGGILAGSWRDVRQLLVREREVSAAEVARREVVEERNRIARELHDIVAHGMSAIHVQAASARYRLADLPPEAADEFDAIAATARSGMHEMRLLLGVLRDDRPDQAPQPGYPELSELLARAPHAGMLTVTDHLTANGSREDPMVELTVYRIVQESLSNVARHAPGAHARVDLRRTADGEILVDVDSDAAAGSVQAAAVTDRGGHGIAGMRERVQLLGGRLSAAPTDSGGFRVSARIPTTQETA